MKKTIIFSLFVTFIIPRIVLAQDVCTDEQKTQFDACLTQCDTTCGTSFPTCVKAPLTLVEIRAAIAAECNCETSKNYGKYRSCVANLINALKKFSLIDAASKAAIGEDNKACKSVIKDKKKNSGKNGKK